MIVGFHFPERVGIRLSAHGVVYAADTHAIVDVQYVLLVVMHVRVLDHETAEAPDYCATRSRTSA